MAKTRNSHGNWLQGVHGDRTRKALNAIVTHEKTGVELNSQSVTSSTTVVPETSLILDVPAGVPVNIYGMIYLSMAAASNVKFDFNAGNAVASWINGRTWLTITGAAFQENAISALSTSVTGGTTTAWTSLEVNITALFSAPGTVQFEFAQNVSGGTATTVQQGSFLVAQPLDHVVTS